MSGNGARVGRAYRHLKTTLVLVTVFFSFWCWRAAPSLRHSWRHWEDGERQLMAPPSLERGQETFQKHLNALLSSKEPDPRMPLNTSLLGSRASHSIMCGDSVKNVCLTVFSLLLPRGGSVSFRWVTLHWPEVLLTPSSSTSSSCPPLQHKDWGWDSQQLGLGARADLNTSPAAGLVCGTNSKFTRGCGRDGRGWWVYKRQRCSQHSFRLSKMLNATQHRVICFSCRTNVPLFYIHECPVVTDVFRKYWAI